MATAQRLLNMLWILIVCLALITANWFQIFKHLIPCPFCFFQRVAMVGIGLSALMNLRFGIRVEHYALGILFSLFGMMFSFRLSPFGGHIMGYSLSSWSAMVFVGSLIGSAILLLLYGKSKTQDFFPKWGFVEKSVFVLFAFLVGVDVITVVKATLL